MFLVEFVTDKIPWLDSSGTRSTPFIRPAIAVVLGFQFGGESGISGIEEALGAGGSGRHGARQPRGQGRDPARDQHLAGAGIEHHRQPRRGRHGGGRRPLLDQPPGARGRDRRRPPDRGHRADRLPLEADPGGARSGGGSGRGGAPARVRFSAATYRTKWRSTHVVEQALSQFAEKETTESFSLQNSKMLKVELSERDRAGEARLDGRPPGRRQVRARRLRRDVADFIKKAMTGEGQNLMKISGTGEVFLADLAQDIQLFRLESESITANGANVLAFEDGIDWDIKRVEGGSGMLGGGLYNMHLEGTGYVALLSDGPPMMIQIGAEPTYADPQAAITWSAGVTTSVEGRREHEDADRPRLRRDDPDRLRRPGLGPDPALRGPGRGAVAERRQRRRCGRRDRARCSAAEEGSTVADATTPAEAIDVIAERFGRHPRTRALHAKGSWCRGTFTPSAAGGELSRAAHLKADVGPGPRAALERRREPAGPRLRARRPRAGRRLRAARRQPHRSGQPERAEVLLAAARRSSSTSSAPTPGARRRGSSRRFLATHPRALRHLPENAKALRPVASFSETRFYGVHAFRWIDADGEDTRPLRLAARGRVSAGSAARRRRSAATTCRRGSRGSLPARWTLDLQIAGPGDQVDEPSSHWPDDRRRVDAGLLELDRGSRTPSATARSSSSTRPGHRRHRA